METDLLPLPKVIWWDQISREEDLDTRGWVYFSDNTRIAVNTASETPLFPDFQELWHPDRITKRHYRVAIKYLGFGKSIAVIDPEPGDD